MHENEKVSKFYKYRYLRQALVGDAAQCLDGFSPLVENYDLAIDHVKGRYGQPRKVIRHIMKSIVDIPPMTSDDHKQLRKYYDTILGKIHDMACYAAKLENPVDAILIPMLESKLSKNLKQDWEKELMGKFDDSEFATLESYADWCLRELRAREAVSESEKDKTNNKTSFSGKVSEGAYSSQALPSNTKVSEGLKTKGCFLCNKAHKLEHCYEFRKRDVSDKWDFAKSQSLCYSCLERYHPNTACSVFRSCNAENCSKRHHPLLHISEDERIDGIHHGTRERGASENNENISVAGVCSDVKETTCRRESLVQIMPSATATITNGSNSDLVRIAFDTMCQDSFISERIVKKLGLKFEHTVDLEVTGFGGERVKLHTGRVNFSLSPIGQKTMFPINAIVKRGQICTPLEAVNIDFENCPHLKDLKIADEYARSESEVDILIGLNHYLKLVSGEIIRHPSANMQDKRPVAMNTVFGYVVFGPNTYQRLYYSNDHDDDDQDEDDDDDVDGGKSKSSSTTHSDVTSHISLALH